jgi:ABC-type antimicrobial peptide transport system permease subunit
MKKRSVLTITGILAGLILVTGLIGCSANTSGPDITGEYSLVKVTVSSIDSTFEGSNLEIFYPPENHYIEVVDDSNLIIVIDTERFECTYQIDGDNVILSGDQMVEENAELTIDGDTLILIYSYGERSTEYIFQKAAESD